MVLLVMVRVPVEFATPPPTAELPEMVLLVTVRCRRSLGCRHRARRNYPRWCYWSR